MTRKAYIVVSGTIFSIVALLHLCRILYGWEAQIGGFVAPAWVSWLSLVVAGYLAAVAFRLLRR
jgi:hypothetical protein